MFDNGINSTKIGYFERYFKKLETPEVPFSVFIIEKHKRPERDVSRSCPLTP